MEGLMGMSLQKLHEIEGELRAMRRELVPLRYRYRRAGAFKTRDRIQAQIDAVNRQIQATEKRLVDSWKD